ncbi:GDSL Lipase/Acylhydrolase [Armillaria borealis]|uniref:GDSL Lipase/Acylhydrolase n=1 Tax=Armillaria borealis TaxID=47425 RepID=A0AA39K058_9AGAR|nr:GDSL Lipase/Acylhydrolase [Armillaria borealis]
MAAYVQDCIMLFGDSITQGAWEDGGFSQRLSYVYARKLDILNRGLSGYNTEWAIPVFEQCFAKQHEQEHVPKVRILTIWFGANDACIKPSPQHVPLGQFTSNIKYLIDLVHSSKSPHYSPDTRIILITPPPVNTYQRSADLQARSPPLALDRLFETTRQYAQAVIDVGREASVPVVDVWAALWNAAGQDERALSKFLSDGLHLNRDGYSIMYELLIDMIAKQMPELHYNNLQPVFAPWAEINWAAPGATLMKRKAEV